MSAAPPSAIDWLPEQWYRFCREHPSDVACGDVQSYYEYRIDLVPNAVFLAFFAISFIGYVATYAATRRGLAFSIAMILGVLCEILGYAGRVGSWRNQWDENFFLLQICTLTIGPAFLAAGVYLCLRRIVYVFGPENSRIPPEYYTRIFIPCDVISLVLQALGGGMASVASHNNDPVDTGNNIMMAGLSFQVFTLLVFIIVAVDFAFNTWRRHKTLGAASLDQNPVLVKVRNSWAFRGFLGALAIATICIFWRCVFRVAELSGGWDGPLMGRQDLFVGFEGVMIVVACIVLNIFHPALAFKEMLEGMGGLGSKRKAKKSVVVNGEGKSENTSDTDAAGKA